ncbi:MAG: hypothetical protein EOO04_32315 [Chitinophagaceae bacterium]|nr:MAG: hypothetical protein EOO04_32315 [Chitinophagaceae bacterium]
MIITTGLEFTAEVRSALKEKGYTHIIHDPAARMQGEENYVHWIEPIRFTDIRHDFEEAELFIQSINDFEVVDMAAGMPGIIFRIKMRHVV